MTPVESTQMSMTNYDLRRDQTPSRRSSRYRFSGKLSRVSRFSRHFSDPQAPDGLDEPRSLEADGHDGVKANTSNPSDPTRTQHLVETDLAWSSATPLTQHLENELQFDTVLTDTEPRMDFASPRALQPHNARVRVTTPSQQLDKAGQVSRNPCLMA
jgi:hypothetical protein